MGIAILLQHPHKLHVHMDSTTCNKPSSPLHSAPHSHNSHVHMNDYHTSHNQPSQYRIMYSAQQTPQLTTIDNHVSQLRHIRHRTHHHHHTQPTLSNYHIRHLDSTTITHTSLVYTYYHASCNNSPINRISQQTH